MPINVCDWHYRSFIRDVVPVCLNKNIGIIGMKGLKGLGGSKDGKNAQILKSGIISAEKLLCYALSQPVSVQIIGIRNQRDLEQEVNDKQRGKGVFAKAIEGIEKLYEIRESKKSKYPKIGITYIVTPLNYFCLEEFFLNAKGYVQDPSQFLQMDFQFITQQIINVKQVCQERNIHFISHPKTLELDNIQNYFSAKWDKMLDKRSRCAFPWIYAEISARGDVTVCHSFYDLPLGNVYEESILDIWNGERINQVRSYLKKQLYPICTACFYYYHNPLITL